MRFALILRQSLCTLRCLFPLSCLLSNDKEARKAHNPQRGITTFLFTFNVIPLDIENTKELAD